MHACMTGQPRAVILPFRREVREPNDDARNSEWDHLLRLTLQAWQWRDPESLDALDTSLQRIRAHIRREWSA